MATIILNKYQQHLFNFSFLFLTTAFNLPSKASHEAFRFTWEIKFYFRRRFAFES